MFAPPLPLAATATAIIFDCVLTELDGNLIEERANFKLDNLAAKVSLQSKHSDKRLGQRRASYAHRYPVTTTFLPRPGSFISHTSTTT